MTTGIPPVNVGALARVAPKVDLHCHLTGSVTLDTLVELAGQRSAGLDVDHLRRAYDLASEPPETREDKFFRGLDLVAEYLATPDHLAFAVHRLAAHSAMGGLRYLELFVNPTALMRTGMSFTEVRDGLVEGARTSLTDSNVIVRFIACFLRDESLATADQMLDALIAHRVDDFIGVGLDGPELLPGTEPARFAEVFSRAGKAGFRRTAHLTETSAQDLEVCLDALGCDRIDHGYPIAEDARMLTRARESGVAFTCCLTITRDILGGLDPRFRDARAHPITTMLDAGLPIVFGTDDGALVDTDIGTEYALAVDWYGWNIDDVRAASMRGLDAAWLDDSDRRELRLTFGREFEALEDMLPDTAR